MVGNFFVKKRKTYYYLLFVITVFLSFIASFQLFGFSNDYFNYIDLFSSSSFNMEPIWIILRFINSKIFSSIYLLIFITSLTSIANKLQSVDICLREKTVLFLIFYFVSYFWLHEYTQFRAALSIAVFFVFSYKVRNSRKKLFLLFVFTLTIHYSCIILFPLLIYLFFKNKKTYIFVPLFFFVFAILFSSTLRNPELIYSLLDDLKLGVLQKVIKAKLGHNSEFRVFNKLYLFIFFLFFISYFLGIKNRTKVDSYYFFCFKLLSYSLTVFYIFACTPFPVLAFRFSEYFLPFSLVLLIKNLDYIKEKYLYILFMVIYIGFLAIKMLQSTGRI